MLKRLPRRTLAYIVGLAVVVQVCFTTSGSGALAAEPVSGKLYAMRFEKHGFINKVRLGAAYLLRPEVANRADVVWGYRLDDTEVQKALSQEKLYKHIYYFNAPNADESTVLNFSASLLAIEKYGSVSALLEGAKSKGVEFGVILDVPAWRGITPHRELINWKGSSGTFVQFKNELMTYEAIRKLLKTGKLEKLDTKNKP